MAPGLDVQELLEEGDSSLLFLGLQQEEEVSFT